MGTVQNLVTNLNLTSDFCFLTHKTDSQGKLSR